MAWSGSWGGWRLPGPWSTSIFNCSSRQVDLTSTSCELSSLISALPTDVYVCPWSLAWIVQILLGSFGSVYYIPQPVCLSRPSEQLTDQAQILFTLRAPKPFLGVLFSPYPWVEGIGGGNERVSSQRPTPVANCNALFDIIFPHPHSFGKLTLVLYLLTNSAIADVKYKLWVLQPLGLSLLQKNCFGFKSPFCKSRSKNFTLFFFAFSTLSTGVIRKSYFRWF